MLFRSKPAASNFLISSVMNSCRSKACFLTFCLTGRAWGQTTSWCSITSLGTPGMSDACHANTSTFSRKKVTSALSYLLSRVELRVKAPPMPSSLTDTLLVYGGSALDFFLSPVDLSGTSSTVGNTPSRCACRSGCKRSCRASSSLLGLQRQEQVP